MHDKQHRRKRPVRKTGLEPLGCLVWLRLQVTDFSAQLDGVSTILAKISE